MPKHSSSLEINLDSSFLLPKVDLQVEGRLLLSNASHDFARPDALSFQHYSCLRTTLCSQRLTPANFACWLILPSRSHWVAWLCCADCGQPWEQKSFARQVQASALSLTQQVWFPRPATGICGIVMSPCQPLFRLNVNYDIVAFADGDSLDCATICDAVVAKQS